MKAREKKIENLRDALNREDARDEASEVMRGLIEEVRLVPMHDQIEIYLVDNLAAILSLCQKEPQLNESRVQLTPPVA